MLSAGGRAAPVGRPRCARGGGLLAASGGRGVPLPVARACGAVLSHSRERTKGRPGAANPGQHHGCPRAPPRLAWGSNLLLCEANCFLARAAWSGWGCYAIRPLAVGRHRWAALVARGLVGLSSATRLVGRLGGTGQERCGPSAMVHGRRSLSSLRRPPQEVAASLNHGEVHNPHAKRGDRRGAPPERTQPSPLPRRGRCHGSCRDG